MCMGLHLQVGHGLSQDDLYRVPNWFEFHTKLHSGTARIDPTSPPRYRIASMPQFAVEAILKTIKPVKTDVLYDLGCGDGRIVITAAKKYGCHCVGVEIDKEIADLARKNVKAAKIENHVTIITADIRKIKLDDADIIMMYLFPDLIKELEPEILKAKCVVSYSHKIPGVLNKEWHIVSKEKRLPFFIWEKPNNDLFGLGF